MKNTKYQRIIKSTYKNELEFFSEKLKENDSNKELCFYIKGVDSIANYNFIDLIHQNLSGDRKHYVFLSSGSSYLKQFPWQPFKNMFFGFFNIKKDTKRLKEKLTRFMKDYKEELATSIGYIADLFSSTGDDSLYNVPLSKSVIFKAFQNFFFYLAKKKRVILFFDKIETFDDVSFELISHLIVSLKDSNIVFVTSSSEDYTDKLKDIHFNMINVDKFDKESCKLAICDLLKSDIDDELLNYIYEGTDNKFYYIEVLLNYLIDNDLVSKSDGKYFLRKNDYISLSNIFISRMGKLNVDEMNLLELISFFGERVSYDILHHLYDKGEFDKNLNNLQILGFVYKSYISEQCYINFSSEELKELIYNSIFPLTKHEIHSKIASFLKNSYSDGYSSIYEILAYHLENALLFDDAVYFYFMAGLKYYSDFFDKKNSYKWFSRALYIAKQLISHDTNKSTFHEEKVNCFNNSFYKVLFTYSYPLSLDISTIFYYTALSSEGFVEKTQDYYLQAIKYAKQYNNTAIVFLSRLEIFKMQFIDVEDTNVLKNYMQQIEETAKESGSQFFLIFSLIVNISLYISKESYKLDKSQIEKFMISKDLLLNDKTYMDKEHKRVLLIFWYFCYANYFKMNYSGPLKTDMIKDIVTQGESYLFYDYDKINYYYRLAIEPLDNTIYKSLYLKKSLEISLSVNNSYYTSANYEELGRLSFEQGRYDEAIDYYKNAEPFLIELDDRERLSELYKNIAYIHIVKKYYKDAIVLLKKSIEHKNKENIYYFSSIKENSIIYIVLSLIFASIQVEDYELTKEYFNYIDEILLYKKNVMSDSILLFYNFLVSYFKLKRDGDRVELQNIKSYSNSILQEKQKSTNKLWLKKFISEIGDELK